MANQSITSIFSLRNQQVVVAEGELRSLDWEVIEGEDLYADVDSLESFSISSGDEDDGVEIEFVGGGADHEDNPGLIGDCEVAVHVLGLDLQVARSEHHYVFDVVGEPVEGDVAPLLDPLGFDTLSAGVYHGQNFVDQISNKDEEDDVHHDDDCVDYEIDVDDELVPWGVGDRLEKQRMRKLGKRTFARMNKSKKMAHFYSKSACLHGKHGLGLKAY